MLGKYSTLALGFSFSISANQLGFFVYLFCFEFFETVLISNADGPQLVILHLLLSAEVIGIHYHPHLPVMILAVIVLSL
jgi:hypothetical protein